MDSDDIYVLKIKNLDDWNNYALEDVRLDLGISQTAMSKITGISQPELSRYENKKKYPSLTTFFKLLEALGGYIAFPKKSTYYNNGE